ncbi:putative Divalent Anion:Na+ Symporter (DASS) Family Protein [Monocercomonoides exilis]|uniref:putative Divalent Anion:Na+ Symporter (DASS) Family Protein n=1 Tax=Monocercomonoides exilis TaxID=2049356 RepID=UPI00355949E8|nr:putative Divalent Anion:Na+ Symporter (DASS) Family Protein [Monocercomonoides exilis]|eukprot:MONOS_2966.1-p1 / transcript=MONOS_2966.1 / gene=MONOS_2966 / organism=Monocercomonoides_exilis_PA203 / gene_product=Divalent Anion:Na+ Symporter (DASS) Family Protein / transcript_product=Divalent Anion:Na+ Symporter (DASS) Family Protein / location=Mono_scaffold00065:74295-77184(+) / protein_length=880 / sequence_SO=supercontig / SO=protein_coding / is_pseudo=false
MKFSRQLQFIAVDRWRKHYINYRDLKKQMKLMFRSYLNSRFVTVKVKPDGQKPRPSLVGNNSMFFTPPSSDQAPTSPHMKKKEIEMVESKKGFPKKAGFSDSTETASILRAPSPALEEESSSSISPPIERSSFSTSDVKRNRELNEGIMASNLTEEDRQQIVKGVEMWKKCYDTELEKVHSFARDGISAMLGRITELQKQSESCPATKGAMFELKREFLDLSVDCSEMDNFIKVNKEGFRKILKKLAKMVSVNDEETGDPQTLVGEEKAVMEQETKEMFDSLPSASMLVEQVQNLYVATFSLGKFLALEAQGSASVAVEGAEEIQLRRQLELMNDIKSSTEAQIAWKKNTILGEYITHQQKAQVNLGAVTAGIDEHGNATQQTEESGRSGITPSGVATDSSSSSSTSKGEVSYYFKVKMHWVIISFIVLIAMGVVPWPSSIARQMRCLGLLVWASILWAFDALPAHVVALFIPILATFLNIVGKTFHDGAKQLVTSTISDTPYLAIGGYSIALAMRHTGLDKKIAYGLLQFRVARKPVVFLLIATALQYLLTMVISNISSTVLVISLVLPVLREVPVRGGFSKMLLMTIAMTGNLAGMATPLASPQSMVGLEAIQAAMNYHAKTSFGTWTVGALPVTVVSTLVCFFFLWCFYKIDVKEVPFSPPTTPNPWTWKMIFVAVVSLITTVFWFIIPYAPFLGNEAIVGLIPFCIFFGFNLVPRTDITELPWNMILLVMGGGALGEAIKDSKLLQLISELFGPTFSQLHAFVQLLILTAIVAFVSIFVSHTVAAIVLIPIVNSVLANSAAHVELILFACALHVSPPMLLAVASFPNMCCYGVEDDDHQPYLTTGDFFKYGGTVTIVSYIIINTVFYGTGLLMGL